MITFDNDELEYLKWVKSNPTGYVINATKGVGYAKLHKATCRTISTDQQTNYTTNQYMKACSLNKQALIEWGKKKSSDFSTCGTCEP